MTQATRPTSITCARCGTDKKVGKGGPIPTYCSVGCRAALAHERSRQDGRYEQGLAKARQQTEEERQAKVRPCPFCGATMAHPRRVQCGADKCQRQYRNERQRDFQQQHRAEHGRSYSRQYDKPGVKEYRIACTQCGQEAPVAKVTARFCSQQCFYDARYGENRPRENCQGARQRLRWKRAKRALEAAARGTRGVTAWVAGHCARCGSSFVRRKSGIGVQHCSKRCQRRDKAARRRAYEAGVQVHPISRYGIHMRDGWTCHICGDPVDRDAVVPDLAAPVLDHVIPLARGGSHSEGNLKTAHFYCNSVKRDLVEGWQAGAG